jgi:hypothetical protein
MIDMVQEGILLAADERRLTPIEQEVFLSGVHPRSSAPNKATNKCIPAGGVL